MGDSWSRSLRFRSVGGRGLAWDRLAWRDDDGLDDHVCDHHDVPLGSHLAIFELERGAGHEGQPSERGEGKGCEVLHVEVVKECVCYVSCSNAAMQVCNNAADPDPSRQLWLAMKGRSID